MLGFARAQPLDVFENFLVLPFVAVVVDPTIALAIHQSRKRRVLDLSGLVFDDVNAEVFPYFGQLRPGAGKKRPIFQVGFESAGVVLQNRPCVLFGIGGNAQQQIVFNLFFLQRPLDCREVGRQQRAHVRTGREYESNQN